MHASFVLIMAYCSYFPPCARVVVSLIISTLPPPTLSPTPLPLFPPFQALLSGVSVSRSLVKISLSRIPAVAMVAAEVMMSIDTVVAQPCSTSYAQHYDPIPVLHAGPPLSRWATR